MSEITPITSELNALSGTTGSRGMYYPTKGAGLDYYPELAKQWDIIAKMVFATAGLRVYKDGNATFGVFPGKFQTGDTAVVYAGATAQTLTLNATNYIYLTEDGTLTVNTTGFPNPSVTPHVPLAVITVGETSYNLTDIIDHRDRSTLRVLSGLTEATANAAATFFAALTANVSEINAACDGFTGDVVNLNEASTFFGATDITGTEAETLTSGNDADTLHIHQGVIRKLASVASIDLNVTTKTTLYTVPTGKTAIITDIIVRNASISLTTASFGCGFDANADDVVTPATHTSLTGATLYEKLAIKVGAIRGAASDVLGLKCGTAQGAAATVTVDVFGYLI